MTRLPLSVLPFAQETATQFVDVILPVPVPNLYTYRVPTGMNELIKPGVRVIVQFGKKRVVTAVVARMHHSPPKEYAAKYVLELLDEEPVITSGQLELFRWMADYYMCYAGEVLNAALPAGLKINSESRLQYNPDFNEAIPFTPEEELLIGKIKASGSLSYEEAAGLFREKYIHKIVKSLIGKQAIILFEEVREKYKPKIIKRIRLTETYGQRESLQSLFATLDKKPKQLNILLKYLQHVPVLSQPELNENGVEKRTFGEGDLSESALKTLIKNGMLEEFAVEGSRLTGADAATDYQLILTTVQQTALGQILELFQTKDTVLLHGVTGSGKTQVYMELIRQVMEGGSQVLYMLPEIALTTQIVERLRKMFGNQMGVYHSKFSDNERVEVWQGILSGRFSFVVGVRSAVFLPFDNLGLIVVDEEHETSYKQHDPAPRYNARDVAMMVARQQHAKVLLGSATPSVETYYHAQQQKYGLVELLTRFGETSLPEIVLVDTTPDKKQPKTRHRFTEALLNELEQGLARNEQAILFQNRRGYSPYITCEECNWVAHCPNCAVSLTYHLHSHQLRCHYCGHTRKLPAVCPACGSTKLLTVGYGTEKVEDELKLLLPKSRIQRMDLDTTRTKNAYQQIIQSFESGETDILIGTQMISKGLDFDRVTLVGIFDADRIIHFPDFRSHERAFQLITQVSGRAGRRDKQGKVIIQTADTRQPILQKIMAGDYQAMFIKEMEERKKYHYPPFIRLIQLTVKHLEQPVAQQAAAELASKLTAKLGKKRVLGPEAPPINRVRNQFLQDILIKLEKENLNLKSVKEFIRQQMQEVCLQKAFRQVTIIADVDPM